MKNKRTKGVP